LTGAGALGHMRSRWTVKAHVAVQGREIAIGFGKRSNFILRNNELYHELQQVLRLRTTNRDADSTFNSLVDASGKRRRREWTDPLEL
jgi:hypothetical protein